MELNLFSSGAISQFYFLKNDLVVLIYLTCAIFDSGVPVLLHSFVAFLSCT